MQKHSKHQKHRDQNSIFHILALCLCLLDGFVFFFFPLPPGNFCVWIYCLGCTLDTQMHFHCHLMSSGFILLDHDSMK